MSTISKQIFMFLFVILIIISPTLSYAGFLKFNATAPIEGIVIDKESNKPISNAKLTFIWSEKGGFASSAKIQKTVLSKENGSFKISRKIFWGCPGLGSRIFELEITHPKYEKQNMTIATLSFKNPSNWAYLIDIKEDMKIYMTPIKDRK